ncbi:universal stress protein [Proteus mirabilis]|uniref:universal stress protein n=1 Tax=Proteus mirabilis TaxID=584 RepID=UPI00189C8695|nr:universal stress protein [Proteus mirabilis]EKW4663060.1 universal stress protein [Proteus mirabilis]ELB1686981.1 universal stress protein [Proteus mirabilis]ELW9234602.1 universal stress protein [Proteus mirabilis]MBI6432471.1 universal stress protein [Proteus mirabilis]UTA56500.1 universal stress protein [Proteus mirabilis]
MYKTILVPIDIDEDNLLNKAITLVENIAKREDPYVHFLYVLPKLPQSSYYRLVMNGDQLDQVCLKKSAEKELKKIIARFDLPEDRIETHICIGKPRDGILQIADQVNADLIVVSSHNPEEDSYHLGSTAADITRYAKRSVMVAR